MPATTVYLGCAANPSDQYRALDALGTDAVLIEGDVPTFAVVRDSAIGSAVQTLIDTLECHGMNVLEVNTEPVRNLVAVS